MVTRKTYPATRAGMRQLAQDIVEKLADELINQPMSFRLREYARAMIEQELDPELGKQRIPRPRAAEDSEIFGEALEWWVHHYFRHHPDFVRIGRGWYERKDEAEIEAEAEADADEDADVDGVAPPAADDPGFIYAFTLPAYRSEPNTPAQRYRVKIGRTWRGVSGRIVEQTKSGGQAPDILGAWKTLWHAKVESCIHALLHLRGRRVTDAPGTEWFWTTKEEVEEMMTLITEGKASKLGPQQY